MYWYLYVCRNNDVEEGEIQEDETLPSTQINIQINNTKLLPTPPPPPPPRMPPPRPLHIGILINLYIKLNNYCFDDWM
jgi:hypothetical protein